VPFLDVLDAVGYQIRRPGNCGSGNYVSAVIKLNSENNYALNPRVSRESWIFEFGEIQYLYKLGRYYVSVLRADSRHEKECHDN
jgi:hypothetical protein